MRYRALSLLLLLAEPAGADEIQRALIQRDRQSAEFSRPELRDLHSQQESRVHLRPDERVLQARERDAVPSPEPRAPAFRYYRALPLPGGPRHGVDPIPVQGVGG
ncbi:MAG TPA: hypothetical protein VFK84_14045 [Burkholderiales bacterium]|nr:hypothetical protein [Burkholderiales bacterium]